MTNCDNFNSLEKVMVKEEHEDTEEHSSFVTNNYVGHHIVNTKTKNNYGVVDLLEIKLEQGDLVIKDDPDDVTEEHGSFAVYKSDLMSPTLGELAANCKIEVDPMIGSNDHINSALQIKVDDDCKSSTSNLDDENAKYKCNKCGLYFSQNEDLKLHKRMHIPEKAFKCSKCEKCFAQKCRLATHLLGHDGKKPFKCQQCDKHFTQKSNLKMHMLIHEGSKPFKCRQCDKSFTQSGSLTTHMLLHEGKKPFKCQRCDSSFTQNSHLKVHVLIHLGNKCFKCQQCDKSFVRNSYLKKHELVHGSKKPFNCQQCGKHFIQKSNL